MKRHRGKMQDQLLGILRRQIQPQSAYALLGQMRHDRPNLAPTSVYRALDALLRAGSIHRVESMKAYVACKHGAHDAGCIMAICDACGAVEERVAPALIDDVSAEASKSGFTPLRHVIEVHGHCADCEPDGIAR